MKNRLLTSAATATASWSSFSSGRFPGDDVDLHLGCIPKHGLDGRSGRQDSHVLEELFISCVIPVEILDVREVCSRFYHVTYRAACRFEYFLHLSQSEKRFLLDRAADRLCRFRVHGALAAYIDPAIHLNSGRI